MAGLNATAHNAMLDANSAVWPPDAMSLHSADPGNGTSVVGGTEISGGTPAYARKALAWNAATSRSKSVTTPPTFDVPGGGTSIGWAGFWRGTTYLGSRPLRNNTNTADVVETFASQGTYIPSTAVTESLA
jgi:hypothetical protein